MAAPGKLKQLAAARGVSVRQLIAEALRETGSVSAAARHLGVSHNSVRFWMQQHGKVIRKRAILA